MTVTEPVGSENSRENGLVGKVVGLRRTREDQTHLDRDDRRICSSGKAKHHCPDVLGADGTYLLSRSAGSFRGFNWYRRTVSDLGSNCWAD